MKENGQKLEMWSEVAVVGRKCTMERYVALSIRAVHVPLMIVGRVNEKIFYILFNINDFGLPLLQENL